MRSSDPNANVLTSLSSYARESEGGQNPLGDPASAYHSLRTLGSDETKKPSHGSLVVPSLHLPYALSQTQLHILAPLAPGRMADWNSQVKKREISSLSSFEKVGFEQGAEELGEKNIECNEEGNRDDDSITKAVNDASHHMTSISTNQQFAQEPHHQDIVQEYVPVSTNLASETGPREKERGLNQQERRRPSSLQHSASVFESGSISVPESIPVTPLSFVSPSHAPRVEPIQIQEKLSQPTPVHSFVSRFENKQFLLIGMVGLPARGKSYLSNKIARY